MYLTLNSSIRLLSKDSMGKNHDSNFHRDCFELAKHDKHEDFTILTLKETLFRRAPCRIKLYHPLGFCCFFFVCVFQKLMSSNVLKSSGDNSNFKENKYPLQKKQLQCIGPRHLCCHTTLKIPLLHYSI